MFVVSQYTKFQVPNSSGSQVIAVKLKVMQIFAQSACSVIFYTKFLSQNLHIFLKIKYHTSLQGPKLSGAVEQSTRSRFRHVVSCGYKKQKNTTFELCPVVQVHSKFRVNQSATSRNELKTKTYTDNMIFYISYFSIKRRVGW